MISKFRFRTVVSFTPSLACVVLTMAQLLSGSVNAADPADEADTQPTLPVNAQVLFGKASDFEQWTGNSDYWSTDGDAIVGINPADNLLPSQTYLIYEGGEFDNFELTAQFKIEGEGGNGGIQYRSKVVDAENFKVAGYQADIDFGNRYAGILYEQDGRGIMAKRGESVTATPEGKLVPKRFGDEAALGNGIHPGSWNDYRIVADGDTLEHYINGALTARVIDHESAKSASSGVIALQLHHGPPMKVRYKNIVLRPINSESN